MDFKWQLLSVLTLLPPSSSTSALWDLGYPSGAEVGEGQKTCWYDGDLHPKISLFPIELDKVRAKPRDKSTLPCSQAVIPSRKTQMTHLLKLCTWCSMPWESGLLGEDISHNRVHKLMFVDLTCSPLVPLRTTVPKYGWMSVGLGLQTAKG